VLATWQPLGVSFKSRKMMVKKGSGFIKHATLNESMQDRGHPYVGHSQIASSNVIFFLPSLAN
jgi:hypothetical protein